MMATSDGIMKHMSCILIFAIIDDVVGYRRQMAEIVLAIVVLVMSRGLGRQLSWRTAEQILLAFVVRGDADGVRRLKMLL